MDVNVRLSSGLANITGSARMLVSLSEDATISDLIEQLCREYPRLAEPLESGVAVISGNHADRSQPLRDGQEVALLIPIAGG
jgi:molybdopterin converting factor small subunit